jgi:hypothetical protein
MRGLAVALVLLFAGCGGSGVDKAGGDHRASHVLTLADGNLESPEVKAFAEEAG